MDDATIDGVTFFLALLTLAASLNLLRMYGRRHGFGPRLKATDKALLRNAVRYAVETGATWVRRQDDRRAQ